MKLLTNMLPLWIWASVMCVPANGAYPAAAHHATYEFAIESTTFTVTYDWSEFEHTGWSLGQGSYKRGQFRRPREFAPFPVLIKTLKFNQEENSLYYDPTTQRLTFLVPRRLESLVSKVFENP